MKEGPFSLFAVDRFSECEIDCVKNVVELAFSLFAVDRFLECELSGKNMVAIVKNFFVGAIIFMGIICI